MNLVEYIKSSIVEMKQVTWPTRKETRNYTALVIGISIALMLFLGLVDYIFNLGLQTLINRQ